MRLDHDLNPLSFLIINLASDRGCAPSNPGSGGKCTFFFSFCSLVCSYSAGNSTGMVARLQTDRLER